VEEIEEQILSGELGKKKSFSQNNKKDYKIVKDSIDFIIKNSAKFMDKDTMKEIEIKISEVNDLLAANAEKYSLGDSPKRLEDATKTYNEFKDAIEKGLSKAAEPVKAAKINVVEVNKKFKEKLFEISKMIDEKKDKYVIHKEFGQLSGEMVKLEKENNIKPAYDVESLWTEVNAKLDEYMNDESASSAINDEADVGPAIKPVELKPDEGDFEDKEDYKKAKQMFQDAVVAGYQKLENEKENRINNLVKNKQKTFLEKVEGIDVLKGMKRQLELLNKNDDQIEDILRNYLSKQLPDPETTKLAANSIDPEQLFNQRLEVINKPNKNLTQGDESAKITYNNNTGGLMEGDMRKEYIKEARAEAARSFGKQDVGMMAKPSRKYVKTEGRMKAIEKMRSVKMMNAAQRRKEKLIALEEQIVKNAKMAGLDVEQNSGKSTKTYPQLDPQANPKENAGVTQVTDNGYNDNNSVEAMKQPFKNNNNNTLAQLKKLELLRYLI
jgi:hypothetical protein